MPAKHTATAMATTALAATPAGSRSARRTEAEVQSLPAWATSIRSGFRGWSVTTALSGAVDAACVGLATEPGAHPVTGLITGINKTPIIRTTTNPTARTELVRREDRKGLGCIH